MVEQEFLQEVLDIRLSNKTPMLVPQSLPDFSPTSKITDWLLIDAVPVVVTKVSYTCIFFAFHALPLPGDTYISHHLHA